MASVFTEGMRRDVDRTMLPGGAVWNLVDFVPDELGGAAAGRGGWTYAGPALTGATAVISVAYHPALQKVIALDNETTPKLWDAVAGTSFTSSLSNYRTQIAPPAYHRGYLIYGSVSNGSTFQQPFALKDDSTVTSLSGAPTGRYVGAIVGRD